MLGLKTSYNAFHNCLLSPVKILTCNSLFDGVYILVNCYSYQTQSCNITFRAQALEPVQTEKYSKDLCQSPVEAIFLTYKCFKKYTAHTPTYTRSDLSAPPVMYPGQGEEFEEGVGMQTGELRGRKREYLEVVIVKLQKCRHMEMRGGKRGIRFARPAGSCAVVVSLKLTGQIQWDSVELLL